MEEMTKIDYKVQQNTNTHMLSVTRKRIKEVKKNNKMMKKTTRKYSENIIWSKIYITMMMQK